MKNVRVAVAVVGLSLWAAQAMAAERGTPQDILRQALLGAGNGAISAELSGGKAGKGALIGAGTNVIGGALLNWFFDTPSAGPATYAAPAQVVQQPSYGYASYAAPQLYTTQTQYVPVQQTVYRPVSVRQPREVVYVQPQPVYSAPAPVYYQYGRPAENTNRRIIRQGLLGAGVGAISAEASGGKAGTGALVGAGSNVIGGALLEMLTS